MYNQGQFVIILHERDHLHLFVMRSQYFSCHADMLDVDHLLLVWQTDINTVNKK